MPSETGARVGKKPRWLRSAEQSQGSVAHKPATPLFAHNSRVCRHCPQNTLWRTKCIFNGTGSLFHRCASVVQELCCCRSRDARHGVARAQRCNQNNHTTTSIKRVASQRQGAHFVRMRARGGGVVGAFSALGLRNVEQHPPPGRREVAAIARMTRAASGGGRSTAT